MKLILALAIGFMVSSGVGAFLVPFLRKIKVQQHIKEIGPNWHMSKSGTPSMGGFMFMAAIAVVCLTVGFEVTLKGSWGHIFVLVFGMVFSIGWTPCVGTFLSAALMQASVKGTALSGMIMLFLYSMGLGIPFLISAILIDQLKSAFGFIKKHYGIINTVCGVFLIIIGILMMTGTFGSFLALLG